MGTFCGLSSCYTANTLTTNPDFFYKHENESLLFFTNSFSIVESVYAEEELVAAKILPMLRYVVVRHRAGRLLLEKVRHFYFASRAS